MPSSTDRNRAIDLSDGRAAAAGRAVDDRRPAGDATATGGGSAAGEHATTPTDIPARGWKEIVLRVKDELKADMVSLMAAGVAFKALLSLFPLMVAAISIYGLVVDPATVSQQINSLAESLPQSAASIIEEQATTVARTEEQSLGFALLASLAAALWAGSGGVASMIQAMNAAYDEEESRSFVIKRGLAIGLAVAGILLGAVMLTAIVVVPLVLEALSLGIVGTVLAQIARWVILAAVIAGALAVLYRIGPNRDDPEFRWTSPGAVIATALWLVGSAAFSFYVSNFGSYNETYGSIAGVIVLMLWLFLSAFIVLLGAEINAEFEHQTAHDTTVGEPEPMGERGATAADTVAAGTTEGDGTRN